MPLREWRDIDGVAPAAEHDGRALEYQFREGGKYRIELRFRDGRHAAGKTTGDSDISTGRFVDLVPIAGSARRSSSRPTTGRSHTGLTMTWSFEPRQESTEVTVMADNVPAAIGRKDHIEGPPHHSRLARFVGRTGGGP